MSSELVVAKFGSEIIDSDEFNIDERLSRYAEVLLRRHAPENLIVISSGAVAVGSRILVEMSRNLDNFTLQQKAQVGGTAIAEAWRKAFRENDVVAGGLFVTHRELEDKREGGSLRRSLNDNRQMGIVTIGNENDPLSDTELMKLYTGGDNDGLGAHFGKLLRADVLELYTSSGGIFDDRKNVIREITEKNYFEVSRMLEERKKRAMLKKGKETKGRGGIISKNLHAYDYSRETGRALIAEAPVDDLNIETTTFYPKAA